MGLRIIADSEEEDEVRSTRSRKRVRIEETYSNGAYIFSPTDTQRLRRPSAPLVSPPLPLPRDTLFDTILDSEQLSRQVANTPGLINDVLIQVLEPSYLPVTDVMSDASDYDGSSSNRQSEGWSVHNSMDYHLPGGPLLRRNAMRVSSSSGRSVPNRAFPFSARGHTNHGLIVMAQGAEPDSWYERGQGLLFQNEASSLPLSDDGSGTDVSDTGSQPPGSVFEGYEMQLTEPTTADSIRSVESVASYSSFDELCATCGLDEMLPRDNSHLKQIAESYSSQTYGRLMASGIVPYNEKCTTNRLDYANNAFELVDGCSAMGAADESIAGTVLSVGGTNDLGIAVSTDMLEYPPLVGMDSVINRGVKRSRDEV